MRSFSLFFVLSLIHRSRAFTLSLPDKFDAGTQVPVQWTRDGADPTSFGLMQRSLLGNQPVLSVTPVQNSGGATSGTTTVVFDTAGQVLLAVIQQQSLVSGERPNQLAAGKQLTVVQGANNLPVVPIATTSTIVAPPTKTVATATTTTSTKPPQPPQATLSSSKTSTTAASSIVSIGSVGAPESATA
ncbi:hypothetical protein C8R46DRAFT_185830 [Mycena filopes]|nr:hypothetical protein C8R46DRAFT_185830 [Mycena filopes]